MPPSPFHIAFFVMEVPCARRFIGEPSVPMTMFLLDRSGQTVEHRGVTHPEHVFPR
ncbi:MAG: hypothetical protein WBC97_01845 [Gemmatimonadales bacterium]